MGWNKVVADFEIKKGKISKAKRVVIYGTEGIGKTTFASKFPDPVFIDTEGSTNSYDVKRMNKPTSWTMLMNEVKYIKEKKPCKTLVIDTADWAENLCIESVCAEKGITGIEDIGYGKGYTYVYEKFGKLLNELYDIAESGINVVVTAHACLRKVEQPDEMGSYDKWEIQCTKAVSKKIKEWADMLLFANYEIYVVDSNGKNKAQGGRRVMYTQHHPCWDAKNREGLPEKTYFSYEVIKSIIEGGTHEQAVTTQEANKEEDKADDIVVPQLDEMNIEMSPDDVQSSIDFDAPEYHKLPKPIVDLMKQDNISIHEMMLAIYKKGFYPADTPVDNIDISFWKMTAANWNKFVEYINESEIQF